MDEEYIPEYEKYGTADYCIIYIPSEEIFSHISSNQPEILEWSIREHRVFLTSPSTLHSTIKLLELASQGSGNDFQEELRDNMESITNINQKILDNIKELNTLDELAAAIDDKLEAIFEKTYLDYASSAEKIITTNAVTAENTRMAAQESRIIILQALVELHERQKSKYIPRSELRAEAKKKGLIRSNSRFSQILSNLEEDGLIARKSLGDIELGSIGVTLKPKAQNERIERHLRPNKPGFWKKRIAELFNDEGEFHFES